MPTKKDLAKVAVLYVRGPGQVRGDLVAAANLAGVKGVDPADPMVRDAIEKEGGTYIPLEVGLPVTLGLKELSLAAEEPKTKDDWVKLAERIKPTIDGIADGSVKASASQSALIRHILDRAYGRVMQSQNEKRPAAGLVILPTLGERGSMDICPECGFKYKPVVKDIEADAK